MSIIGQLANNDLIIKSKRKTGKLSTHTFNHLQSQNEFGFSKKNIWRFTNLAKEKFLT